MSAARTDGIFEGYMAGLRSGADLFPDCHKDRGVGFKHGWLNARDDRLSSPRECAAVLRARAGMIKAAKA